MNKLKVAIIFGTRPDAIKMVPLVKELKANSNINTTVCVTAQHREMLDQVLDIFKVVPDYDLNIMQSRQTLEHITTRSLEGLSATFEEIKPDVVLVHGDTTTCFSASLAAFYKKIKVGHVEAGLRTFDKYYPYPEEMNRRLTGVLADFHFCPTPSNKANLLREGINENAIYITGNTVIDALKTTVKKDYIFKNEVLRNFDFKNKKVITVEAHRRENLGTPLENICNAVRVIADSFDDIEIIYPVHLNPAVREVVGKVLGNHSKIYLIDPIDVQDMHNLIDRSYMIMTDSGGLQEEAPSLGKPVLVLRNETERPEAVKAGTVALAGTDRENIIKLASKLISNTDEYSKMSKAVNPYGDGKASQRIVKALLYEFGFTDVKPEDFKV
ncbi:MAG: UDP-N-acetylglucosamine 2-epimerase (non-hydrolyzing) [Clostridiaceae bacterium]|jgi:UDP-N-acetylglucosamine 2-epimerase (non-hydrolysing)|nr:UDP-N-acetylglucosamine 2-epimerase (non-hydrolyzing) [Clostridiaceae bacterium]